MCTNKYVLTILGNEIPMKPELFEANEKLGWKLYILIFCYIYTAFSIFFTSYIFILSNVFHFKIVGKLLGVF